MIIMIFMNMSSRMICRWMQITALSRHGWISTNSSTIKSVRYFVIMCSDRIRISACGVSARTAPGGAGFYSTWILVLLCPIKYRVVSPTIRCVMPPRHIPIIPDIRRCGLRCCSENCWRMMNSGGNLFRNSAVT